MRVNIAAGKTNAGRLLRLLQSSLQFMVFRYLSEQQPASLNPGDEHVVLGVIVEVRSKTTRFTPLFLKIITRSDFEKYSGAR